MELIEELTERGILDDINNRTEPVLVNKDGLRFIVKESDDYEYNYYLVPEGEDQEEIYFGILNLNEARDLIDGIKFREETALSTFEVPQSGFIAHKGDRIRIYTHEERHESFIIFIAQEIREDAEID